MFTEVAATLFVKVISSCFPFKLIPIKIYFLPQICFGIFNPRIKFFDISIINNLIIYLFKTINNFKIIHHE